MTRWTKTDGQLAHELEDYVARVRLCGAKSQWTIADKNTPWVDYYDHTSNILRKMRASRRRRVEAQSE
jgi:hypothetical protein